MNILDHVPAFDTTIMCFLWETVDLAIVLKLKEFYKGITNTRLKYCVILFKHECNLQIWILQDIECIISQDRNIVKF